jgi:hypothetical protein
MRIDSTEERPALSAAALEEWTRLVEHVLRGIAHALNNRAAALSAAIELASDPTEDVGVVATILAPELERVSEVVAIVRTISVPRPSEAFLPAEAALEALAVLRVHPDLRDRHFAFTGGASAPIRASRRLFSRAVIVLGVLAASAQTDVTIIAEERDDWIEVRVAVAASGRSAYLAEVARAMGGDELSGGSTGFRVPTLAALRRREGRAG